jgi:hypothetical protein
MTLFYIHPKSVRRMGLINCCLLMTVAPQALAVAASGPGSSFRAMGVPMMGLDYSDEINQVVEVRETVRKYFPETWIWDLVPLE